MTIDTDMGSKTDPVATDTDGPKTGSRGRNLPSLRDSEQWCLNVLRHLFTGAESWTAAQRNTTTACGLSHIESVIVGFDRFAETLAGGARRRLIIARATSITVTADELALLNLLAAAQSGAYAHVVALARWLVTPSYQGRLVSAAATLGTALSSAGIPLTQRRAAGAPDYRTSVPAS
jgi:hypothetical protein